ncbi:MAG: anthranilate phosphoribosyltransferase [Eubacteriaceae bacterium]
MQKEMSMKEYGQVITRLINKESLSKEESKKMFIETFKNKQTQMQQGAFLGALSTKGPTPAEIAGSYEAIYEMDTFKVDLVTDIPVVDNCGTGMDTFKTFNISTAASIIAAAAGIPMAKHGSRGLTSMCGAIDILEALGIDMNSDVDIVKSSIEKAGIGIFNGMSSKVHPVALGRVLSQISFGSILNISASLANPGLPIYGVRGVCSKELLDSVPEIMKEIGYQKAIVLYGEVGNLIIDEASTLGTTYVRELREDGSIENYTFTPEEMGIVPGVLEEIKNFNSLEASATSLINTLKGKETRTRLDIVALNAGLVIYLMGKSVTIRDGYRRAFEIIENGSAFQRLVKWVMFQNRDSRSGIKILREMEKKGK